MAPLALLTFVKQRLWRREADMKKTARAPKQDLGNVS
jgi:hypothetical protein